MIRSTSRRFIQHWPRWFHARADRGGQLSRSESARRPRRLHLASLPETRKIRRRRLSTARISSGLPTARGPSRVAITNSASLNARHVVEIRKILDGFLSACHGCSVLPVWTVISHSSCVELIVVTRHHDVRCEPQTRAYYSASASANCGRSAAFLRSASQSCRTCTATISGESSGANATLACSTSSDLLMHLV